MHVQIQELKFLRHVSYSFCVQVFLRREVIVRFADIGGMFLPSQFKLSLHNKHVS